MNAAAEPIELPTNACCRDCEYLLRGLERSVCPECGRPFDPDNARSYRLLIDPAEAQMAMSLDMKIVTWLGLGVAPVVLVFFLALVLGLVRV